MLWAQDCQDGEAHFSSAVSHVWSAGGPRLVGEFERICVPVWHHFVCSRGGVVAAQLCGEQKLGVVADSCWPGLYSSCQLPWPACALGWNWLQLQLPGAGHPAVAGWARCASRSSYRVHPALHRNILVDQGEFTKIMLQVQLWGLNLYCILSVVTLLWHHTTRFLQNVWQVLMFCQPQMLEWVWLGFSFFAGKQGGLWPRWNSPEIGASLQACGGRLDLVVDRSYPQRIPSVREDRPSDPGSAEGGGVALHPCQWASSCERSGRLANLRQEPQIHGMSTYIFQPCQPSWKLLFIVGSAGFLDVVRVLGLEAPEP